MRPMLAAAVKSLSWLRYPLLASSKIDGIRALVGLDGRALSRSLKPIPNGFARARLETLPLGLDGELCLMTGGKPDFRATASGIMSREGEPEFTYMVFDWFSQAGDFETRLARLRQLELPSWVRVLEQKRVENPSQVEELFAVSLAEGFEGLILRDPQGAYKHNRSTLREQGMLKMKPWEDAEATVIDVLEEQRNDNEQRLNELGLAKRSSHLGNKVPKGTMGKLVVQDLARWGKSFEIGTGFTQAEREEFWQQPPLGRLAKFKFISVGGYDVPRHCSFLGLREDLDL